MSESLYLPYIISYVIVGLPRPTTGGTTSAQPPVFKCFTSNFLTTAAKARLLRLLSSSKDMLRSYSEMNVSNTPKSSRRDRMTSTTLWLSSLDKCRELTVRGERQGGMYSALLCHPIKDSIFLTFTQSQWGDTFWFCFNAFAPIQFCHVYSDTCH